MSDTLLKKKWRPALWMVVFGVLMLVALLPLIGLLLIIVWETFTGLSFKLRSVVGLLTLALGSMVMAGVIGAIFLRTLLHPLQALIARTEEIENGHEEAFRQLDYGGTEEIATLGERFFRLARRLSDRSNYLTLFTTHVSHELKTPLTSIQGAAELLRDNGATMSEKQREKFLTNIIDDTARFTALSTRLRELARAEVADTGGRCSLDRVIENCTKAAGLILQVEGNFTHNISMSEQNFSIIWKQLAENAAQHGAGKMTVLLREMPDELRLFIGDDGALISEANQAQMFNAFFTTRRDEGGTGMGLGIAQAMLRSHGGDIKLSNEANFKFEMLIQL